MGGSFDKATGKYNYVCKGNGVTKALDKVFSDPSQKDFQDAQGNNHFDRVLPNDPNNWKELLIAYGQAGVKVKGKEFDVWCQYLEELGTGPNGSPDYIYQIAQTRMNALNSGTGYTTKTHDTDHKVKIDPNAREIDSPCPP